MLHKCVTQQEASATAAAKLSFSVCAWLNYYKIKNTNTGLMFCGRNTVAFQCIAAHDVASVEVISLFSSKNNVEDFFF